LDHIYAYFRIEEQRLTRQLIIELREHQKAIDEIEGATPLAAKRYKSVAEWLIEQHHKILENRHNQIAQWIVDQRIKAIEYKKRIKDESKTDLT
jgi:hypothetical protein